MKLDFNLERFNSVLDKCVADLEEELRGDPTMLLSEATSLTAQFQFKLQEKYFSQTVKNIQTGFMFLPADSLALLLAAGYQMGLDDSKATDEIAELENLFRKEING